MLDGVSSTSQSENQVLPLCSPLCTHRVFNPEGQLRVPEAGKRIFLQEDDRLASMQDPSYVPFTVRRSVMSTWGETTKPRLSTQTSISLYCCNVVMGHVDGSASSPGKTATEERS